MGAWGVGILQDDSALDWVEEAYASEGEEAVRTALETAASARPGDYLEYDEGVAARAAAEVVAASFGAPPDGIEADGLDTLMEHSDGVAEDDTLITLALSAVRRVASDNSEIAELWAEQDDTAAEWTAAIEGLEARLRGLT
ncbi:DUF4259 domain-containing protein [Tateyamaria sp. SN6-1]|uniref:DUF4259 domain-containing protein n=1 Tax=Tateyamaria sp. SN6-1 TaxID=3092148 RepID=UPI0039F62DE6